MNKEQIISLLELQPHPEGGYYKEIFRSDDEITVIRNNEAVIRNTLTSIYFLLGSGDRSVFHRLQSDEVWYYHSGGSATIYCISPEGTLDEKIIGPGGEMQVIIPRNHWFGALVHADAGFILVSCAVAPGFDFDDFEMPDRACLLALYPQFHELIHRLT